MRTGFSCKWRTDCEEKRENRERHTTDSTRGVICTLYSCGMYITQAKEKKDVCDLPWDFFLKGAN